MTQTKQDMCVKSCSKREKSRQCTYNTTFRHVEQPPLQWTSTKYYISWVCFCSFRYPAFYANAPHCHLSPAPLYDIFQHYLIKRHDFRGGKERSSWTENMSLDFPHNFRLKHISFEEELSQIWIFSTYIRKGESNGNLPLRTFPGCIVPEPYRSPDWALVPAEPA
jgi:hypothetical protein